jgi:hypothetical protein
VKCDVLLKIKESEVKQVVNLALLDHLLVVVLGDLAEEINKFCSQR